ncbi:MAG: type II toxin-antitoxin system prevent-host-death family antitoxin [Anaerolineae bacterium]|nr:type II toxin-antitoxin system prevent-host-death family antitoxin [Anaerolineae bacterium]
MKYISAAEARDKLAHVINEVAYGGQQYIVERRGQPLAVLVSVPDYQSLVGLLSEAGVHSEIHGIPVHIRFDGERFFVSDNRFGLYGEGPTLDAARNDYWLALQDYYADLQADADRLAPYLAEHLAELAPLLAAAESETK